MLNRALTVEPEKSFHSRILLLLDEPLAVPRSPEGRFVLCEVDPRTSRHSSSEEDRFRNLWTGGTLWGRGQSRILHSWALMHSPFVSRRAPSSRAPSTACPLRQLLSFERQNRTLVSEQEYLDRERAACGEKKCLNE
ncbi:hypothetical protein CDAR_594801 [Caerostris darwini]|uniref:Uncharacterized protein n=1 Tax=Caerostris darwini TaxID=1538125 RepID=A0AAV4P9N8_9ARAC|nr:hypothetical protein CDAR_594801 [Caerostris darwini]